MSRKTLRLVIIVIVLVSATWLLTSPADRTPSQNEANRDPLIDAPDEKSARSNDHRFEKDKFDFESDDKFRQNINQFGGGLFPIADEDSAPSPSPSPYYLTVTPSPKPSATVSRNVLTHDPLFTEDEINLLNRSAGQKAPSGLVGGGTRKPPAPEEGPTARVSPTQPSPEPSETPDELPRVQGQARGYAMLSLLQPNARQTSEAQLSAMIDAQIQQVFLGVLTDGTFGKDFDYLRSVLQRLNDEGRDITLALYLSNGPAMRRGNSVTNSAFDQINPEDFRSRIRTHPPTRSAFVALAEEVRPIFEFNRALNPSNRNIAIVMLEDNLDAPAYAAMRALAASVLGDLVEFVRNPCPGCFEGNDSDSLGDPIELHNSNQIGTLTPRDGFTLDGEGFNVSGEQDPDRLAISDLYPLMVDAFNRNLRYVGLWRHERQGVDGSGVLPPPDERTYEVPSAEQVELEVDILRHGLQQAEEQ